MYKIDFTKDKTILVVGAGGTGSWFIPILSKLGVENKHVKDVFIVDGDAVEPKNLLRQLFSDDDVNKYKSETLGKRYGFNYSTSFIDKVNDISCIFDGTTVPFIISLVDNNGTRLIFDEIFHNSDYPDFIYVDSGNSQRSGQIYVAIKKDGKIIYETGVNLDEGLQDTSGSNRRPTEISCAEHAQEPKDAQNLMANVTAACIVGNVVSNIIENDMLLGNKYSFDCNTITFKIETVENK